MSAQAGRSMSVKIKNDAGEFIPLVGLRTRALKFNSEAVNITHPDSIDAWRELLPGAGVKTIDIVGSGVFANSESDALARQLFFDQSIKDYQIALPRFGQIDGPFLIQGLNYLGTYSEELTYELTLISAGAPTFTVAT